MGNFFSADRIGEHHLHIDTTCNTEEPQQKYRLGKVSNRLLGAKHVLFIFSSPGPWFVVNN